MQKQPFSLPRLQASKTCKELFQNFNTILGKKNSTSVPSSFESDDLPQVFSEYFTDKICSVRKQLPCKQSNSLFWSNLLHWQTPTDIHTSHWTICFGNSAEDCPQVMWSWSHFHETAVWKPWRSSSHNHKHHRSALPWPLVSYHPTWKLRSSKLC